MLIRTILVAIIMQLQMSSLAMDVIPQTPFFTYSKRNWKASYYSWPMHFSHFEKRSKSNGSHSFKPKRLITPSCCWKFKYVFPRGIQCELCDYHARPKEVRSEATDTRAQGPDVCPYMKQHVNWPPSPLNVGHLISYWIFECCFGIWRTLAILVPSTIGLGLGLGLGSNCKCATQWKDWCSAQPF